MTGRVADAEHLVLGYQVLHGTLRRDQPVLLPHSRRPEHLAILGKTGTGKSSLLRFLCEQDIRDDRGFVFFDLHGDATPTLARIVAREEERRGEDLSRKFVVLDPSDREYSVGINVLEIEDEHQRYVQLADLTQILKDRWQLEAFGGRTEELLRNSLQVLQDNRLTFVDLGPLLTNSSFRKACLTQTRSTEARTYFTSRYARLSEAAQAENREAVLNKVTVFSADPHFRHLLGQAESTVQMREIVEGGYWVIINLDKGKLGEQATTLGSLLLTRLKHALFARRSRSLLSLYCDELQNLVALSGGLDSLLAEARKLAVSVVSANQYLDQYPEAMQAAVLSVGTLLFFQVSGFDSDRIEAVLGSHTDPADKLRRLPPRQMVVKLAYQPARHVGVPQLPRLFHDPSDLMHRSRVLWAERRAVIEEEIELRTAGSPNRYDPLQDWE
jgi:hypothetical protein